MGLDRLTDERQSLPTNGSVDLRRTAKAMRVPWFKRLWPFKKRKREVPSYVEWFVGLSRQGGVPFTLRELEGIRARERYGVIVVVTYFILVALQIVSPLVLLFIAAQGQPDSFSSGLKNVKDFTVALSASLSGIGSLAGYVVGHYFGERH